MKAPELVRLAPFSSLVAASWLCMLLGGMMGLSIDRGVGAIWRFLIIPGYSILLGATVLARPLGEWAMLPMVVILLFVVDLGIHRLRRAA